MKYVLGLSFLFEFYKSPAILRLFVGDNLIDELILDKDIKDSKNLRMYEGEIPVPEKIFTYVLPDRSVKGQIKIEVENDNNNYTNGFMTKFSFLLFRSIFLIPERFIERESFKVITKKLRQTRYEKYEKLNITDESQRVPGDIGWPTEWRKLNEIGKLVDHEGSWWERVRGGSFTLELPIINYNKEQFKIIGPMEYKKTSTDSTLNSKASLENFLDFVYQNIR